jgi:hypothetical protein
MIISETRLDTRSKNLHISYTKALQIISNENNGKFFQSSKSTLNHLVLLTEHCVFQIIESEARWQRSEDESSSFLPVNYKCLNGHESNTITIYIDAGDYENDFHCHN